MHRNSFFDLFEESLTNCLFRQVSDFVSDNGRRPVFIEVGANDGVISSNVISFIQDNGWTGLAIEPVPHVYAQLQKNYERFPAVKTLNLAISDRQGILPFYQVVKDSDTWYPMLSSFDREVIIRQKNLIPDVEDYIQEIKVQTDTLRAICDAHDLEQLDVLITDAEGHDDIIVKTLNFNRYRPSMITIEHLQLSPDRLRDFDTFLLSFGYQRLIMWKDTAYFCGNILKDECVHRLIRTMPVVIPDYDPQYGNGYWLDYFGSSRSGPGSPLSGSPL